MTEPRDTGRFARVGELDDLALLPKRFDMFAAEVRGSFELLGNKILPTLDVIKQSVGALIARVEHLERKQHDTDDRLKALERQKAKQK